MGDQQFQSCPSCITALLHCFEKTSQPEPWCILATDDHDSTLSLAHCWQELLLCLTEVMIPQSWAPPPSLASFLSPLVFLAVGVYGNWSLPFLSITLHLKISCPSSPAVPMGRGMSCPVPQVKIEMESDYDSDIDHHHPRDMSSETTL